MGKDDAQDFCFNNWNTPLLEQHILGLKKSKTADRSMILFMQKSTAYLSISFSLSQLK